MLSVRVTVTSRKCTEWGDMSKVNLMLLAMCGIKVVNEFVKFLLSVGPNHKNVVNESPPNLWFVWGIL